MAQLLPRGLAALCRCVPRGIVWTYLYVAVQTRFHDEYPDYETFPESSIKRLVDKFERTGLVHDAKHRGRKNVVMPEKYAELKERVEATSIMWNIVFDDILKEEVLLG